MTKTLHWMRQQAQEKEELLKEEIQDLRLKVEGSREREKRLDRVAAAVLSGVLDQLDVPESDQIELIADVRVDIELEDEVSVDGTRNRSAS